METRTMNNLREPEPITGPGIAWAIGQINKRFERELAKPVPSDGSEKTSSVLNGNEEQTTPLIIPN